MILPRLQGHCGASFGRLPPCGHGRQAQWKGCKKRLPLESPWGISSQVPLRIPNWAVAGSSEAASWNGRVSSPEGVSGRHQKLGSCSWNPGLSWQAGVAGYTAASSPQTGQWLSGSQTGQGEAPWKGKWAPGSQDFPWGTLVDMKGPLFVEVRC